MKRKYSVVSSCGCAKKNSETGTYSSLRLRKARVGVNTVYHTLRRTPANKKVVVGHSAICSTGGMKSRVLKQQSIIM